MGCTGAMDDWIKKIQEDAKKETMAKKVESLVDADPEWKEKSELIDTQIKLMKKEIKKLEDKKVDLRITIGNRKLKEMGSTYVIKRRDPTKSPFGDFTELLKAMWL